MPKDKLIIDPNSPAYVTRIVWFIAESEDLGANLGETTYTARDLEKATSPSERDHIAATIAAGKSKGVERAQDCYEWNSVAEARQALRECNAAIAAARSKVPWPDWALKAKGAGWKPPKGWAP